MNFKSLIVESTWKDFSNLILIVDESAKVKRKKKKKLANVFILIYILFFSNPRFFMLSFSSSFFFPFLFLFLTLTLKGGSGPIGPVPCRARLRPRIYRKMENQSIKTQIIERERTIHRLRVWEARRQHIRSSSSQRFLRWSHSRNSRSPARPRARAETRVRQRK